MPYKAKERQREHAKQYATLHKEELSEYKRNYSLLHKEEISARRKKHRAEHKEEIHQRDKKRDALRREAHARYSRTYYHKHRLELVEYKYARAVALKIEVLTHYGKGECACVVCKYNNLDALSIDHINGNGNVHRQTLGNNQTGNHFYLWLKRNGYPEGYQTLCMNCQWIKRAKYREHGPKFKEPWPEPLPKNG